MSDAELRQLIVEERRRALAIPFVTEAVMRLITARAAALNAERQLRGLPDPWNEENEALS